MRSAILGIRETTLVQYYQDLEKGHWIKYLLYNIVSTFQEDRNWQEKKGNSQTPNNYHPSMHCHYRGTNII